MIKMSKTLANRILRNSSFRLPVKCSTSIQVFQVPYRPYCWKNFSLEDDLNLEVKQSIEKKWSKKVYGVECPAERSKIHKPDKVPGKYVLSMFPYPSGRLHLGHVRVYTLSDILARYYRLQGYPVVHPMGWDAFGLPAENAARDNGVEAESWTRENISFMKKQIIEMGCSFDWEREFATCDPTYYKWTQWIFNKLFENGLAYKKRAYVYWDPVDKTVLAEEQVDSEMRSWRSGAKVERKLLQQWFIRTAVFAERLSAGLTSGQLKSGWRDVVDLQKHWIGDIKGFFTDCFIDISKILNESKSISAKEPMRLWFSSEDALKQAKYIVLRGDHFLVENDQCVLRTLDNGVKIMKFSITNPVTGKPLPVFSGPSDLMPCVPSSSDCRVDEILNEEEYEELAANESFLSEISKLFEQIEDIPETLDAKSTRSFKCYPASLKLRDWLVSRQRKWGTPIPAVNCLDCGEASVISSDELPIVDLSSKPSGACTHCGSSNISRETDTLDTFFDSSWYFLRYLDPNNHKTIFDQQIVKQNLPVDIYIGGKEHATLHLYYARFMTNFLRTLDLVPVDEPFQKLIPIGIVMGEAYIVKGSGKYLSRDECTIEEEKSIKSKETGEPAYSKWEKMSKSKYNGIDPELVIKEYGIDTTRLLTMAEAVPTSPRKWPLNNPDSYLKWQSRCWLLLRQFTDAKDFGDIVFVDDEVWQKSENEIFDARNYFLKHINHNYDVTSQVSVVISRLQGLFGALRKVPKVYLKESVEFERALGTAIISMYPIMPAFSAQLWQSFRAVATCSEPEFDLDHEVWEQRWPTVDWRYQLDLICKVKGEEIIAKVERNYLDTMDQETALEIAFDQPEVQKRITRDNSEIGWFKVEPGFRATISLRVKKSPDNNDSRGSGKDDEDNKVNVKA